MSIMRVTVKESSYLRVRWLKSLSHHKDEVLRLRSLGSRPWRSRRDGMGRHFIPTPGQVNTP